MRRALVLTLVLLLGGCASPDDRADPTPATAIQTAPTATPAPAATVAPSAAPPAATSAIGSLPSWASAFEDHVTILRDGDALVVTSDGLPRHEYGPFPDMDDSNRDGRPDNPNSVRSQTLTLRVPASPTPAANPGALSLGPIAMAISGVAIFDARNAEGQDAMAVEVFDACGGHPEMRGLYHYHAASPCVERGTPGDHAGVFGVAKDGYALYGQQGSEGDLPTDLDACNGHEDALRGYHYHLTPDAPYTLGCYHGTTL